jgi:hypothetical protein
MTLRTRYLSKQTACPVYALLVDVERGYMFALMLVVPLSVSSVAAMVALAISGGWVVLTALCLGFALAFTGSAAWIVARLFENHKLVRKAAMSVSEDIRSSAS